MSDNDKKLPEETPDDADFPVEDRVAPEESANNAPSGKMPAMRKTIARGAVLLSLAVLAIVVYMAFGDWRNSADSDPQDSLASIGDLERRLDESESAIAALRSRIEAIPSDDFGSDIDAVRREVNDQLELLGSLPSRMSTLENLVASLAGISVDARETFLLAEAEYYLQIANAQLQLANNPHLAILALSMADERVTQLSDPALTGVRRAISDELAALEVMQKPDLEGVTLTLASLARVVESLPLASTRAQNEDAVVDTEQGNVDRAWQSVKDAMTGLVKVTPPEQAKLALLSPDAEYFLRNNVAMQLQAARFALLRGEQEIFEQILDDTSAVLETYFDAGSAQVASTQETIAEIRTNVFTATAPDISESLRLLRQVKALRETGR